MAEQRKLDPAREQNRRRIYVSQRLPLIKQELAQLKSERIKIKEDSKSAEGKKKVELHKRLCAELGSETFPKRVPRWIRVCRHTELVVQ